MKKPPFYTRYKTLFVSFMASAEFETFIALGWPLPESMIDLHAEYRNVKHGLLKKGAHYGLLDVATTYKLRSITKAEKTNWRNVILRGGPWSSADRQGIIEYNMTDVIIMIPL